MMNTESSHAPVAVKAATASDYSQALFTYPIRGTDSGTVSAFVFLV
jgi:hypothetical protein